MILSKFFKNHITIPQATELFEEVKSQTHPDIANLKRLVNFHKAPVGTKDEMQALDLKYRAMTHVPTTIEKTMTPEQLFNIQNPLWACGYTIQELYDWFKYRKPLDDYNRVDAIIKVSEQLNNTIKKQYSRERT